MPAVADLRPIGGLRTDGARRDGQGRRGNGTRGGSFNAAATSSAERSRATGDVLSQEANANVLVVTYDVYLVSSVVVDDHSRGIRIVVVIMILGLLYHTAIH
jgi:hypothetical protein